MSLFAPVTELALRRGHPAGEDTLRLDARPVSRRKPIAMPSSSTARCWRSSRKNGVIAGARWLLAYRIRAAPPLIPCHPGITPASVTSDYLAVTCASPELRRQSAARRRTARFPSHLLRSAGGDDFAVCEQGLRLRRRFLMHLGWLTTIPFRLPPHGVHLERWKTELRKLVAGSGVARTLTGTASACMEAATELAQRPRRRRGAAEAGGAASRLRPGILQRGAGGHCGRLGSCRFATSTAEARCCCTANWRW